MPDKNYQNFLIIFLNSELLTHQRKNQAINRVDP